MMASKAGGQSSAARISKRVQLMDLFSPTSPIEEEELFNGRLDQISRLLDSVFQRGQHAVVYGDRGVGKTSLVNTFESKIFNESLSVTHFYKAKCFRNDAFSDMIERAFDDKRYADGTHISDDVDSAFDATAMLKLCRKLEKHERPVIIFDEFDRIEDPETKLVVAETIKLLSDEAPRTTIIVVGIGRTIEELLFEHRSVARAARQIEMPRMSNSEINEIVSSRLAKASMSITSAALDRINRLARGMPGYAHLIGLYAGIACSARAADRVTASDVTQSLETCIQEAGESVRQAYAAATDSSKPNAQFKEVLLACALAKQDEFGAFKAAGVRDTLSEIVGEYRDIPSFARHLKLFQSEERGSVLMQTGTQKNYKYHFTDPMMQSYVIIKGIRDKMIDYDQQDIVKSSEPSRS